MDIIEIIKDALEFPSKNPGTLSIYILLSIVVGTLAFGGIISCAGFIFNSINYLIGILYLMIAFLLSFILYGFHLRIIKSGIESEEEVSDFDWNENFNNGLDNFIVSIVYFIIPTVIVLIVGLVTNILGNMLTLSQGIVRQSIHAVNVRNFAVLSINSTSPAIANLVISSAITIVVAFVVYLIFSFLYAAAEARLANTGNIKEALNVYEAAKDIKKMGIPNVLELFILIVVIMTVIEIILTTIFNFMPFLAIVMIIVGPYLTLFTKRAVGLLYSEIV